MDTMNPHYIGERIKTLRKQRSIVAEEMSLALDKGITYISKIENRYSFPSWPMFLRICEYLDVTPDEFFDNKNIAPTHLRELLDSAKGLSEENIHHITAIAKSMKKE